MQARVVTLMIRPIALDDAIGRYCDEIVPVATEYPGCHALILGVNRDTGKAISISLWDEADRRASEESGTLFERLARFDDLVTSPPIRELFEVNLWEHSALDPAVIRISSAQIRPGMLSLADAYFRQTVLQELRQQPGYCAALTLTDPSTGKGMVSTGWQSRQTLTDTEAETGFYRWGMARFRDFTVGPVSREAYDIAVRIVRVNEFRSR